MDEIEKGIHAIDRSAPADRSFYNTATDAQKLTKELQTWQDSLEQEIETAERRSRAQINRWWAVWQQIIVLILFVMGAILIIFSLGFSIHTLLTVETGHQVDVAKWILETLLAAFVAGLIGFTMVKSFEKM